MAREHDERKIEFTSMGTVCRGTLHLPPYSPHAPRGDPPGVVLAHGFGGTADCTSLVSAARRFAQAGLVALVFDYRYFGASDGTPRQKLSTIAQQAGRPSNALRGPPRRASDALRRRSQGGHGDSVRLRGHGSIAL